MTMTREETIKWLICVKEEVDESEGTMIYISKEQAGALGMAIEALTERTGEWIDKGNWMGIECSRCKCHSRYVTPFCPQCGSRMLREEKSNENNGFE